MSLAQKPQAALILEDVTLGYDGHPACHHVSGRFEPGSLTALCGPNGAGKSTLLKGLIGALKPLGGRIRYEGASRREIAYMPQSAALDSDFPIDVFDFVAMGAAARAGLFGAARAQRHTRAALEAVGLSGFERRRIGALSGGQMQRLLFARLMTQDAPVILLDEPFAAVDTRTTADLVAIIERWSAEGRTIIAVLHDFALARAHFPQSLLLARETIHWGATADALSSACLARAQMMSEAFDDHARACERAA
jgi:zinc/manganese transport system ATP-binding protein